jgi:Repeat of unknown function (DUF5648)
MRHRATLFKSSIFTTLRYASAALFALSASASAVYAQEAATAAGAVAQQLQRASELLTQSASQQDKAKVSVNQMLTVQYSAEGALGVVDSLSIDVTGRYAVELWATRSYYTNSPGSFSGIPLGKKIIGSFSAGTFLREFWTIIPFTRAVPAGYYPTLLITRDDGSDSWPFSVALSSTNEFMNTESVTAGVFEFYAPSLNHYFVTANTAEAANLANNPQLGWRLTGDIQIHANRVAQFVPGFAGVCRFYGHPTIGPNSHFYTADEGECNFLKQLQLSTPFGRPRWNYEEISFASIATSAGQCGSYSPVVRFYNNGAAANDSNHRYVTTQASYDTMVRAGWRNEGSVMCVARATPNFDPALYR